jgi:hypothetical protein
VDKGPLIMLNADPTPMVYGVPQAVIAAVAERDLRTLSTLTVLPSLSVDPRICSEKHVSERDLA